MEGTNEQSAWYGPFRGRRFRRGFSFRSESSPLCAPRYGSRRRSEGAARERASLSPHARQGSVDGAFFFSNEMLEAHRQQLLESGLERLLEERPKDMLTNSQRSLLYPDDDSVELHQAAGSLQSLAALEQDASLAPSSRSYEKSRRHTEKNYFDSAQKGRYQQHKMRTKKPLPAIVAQALPPPPSLCSDQSTHYALVTNHKAIAADEALSVAEAAEFQAVRASRHTLSTLRTEAADSAFMVAEAAFRHATTVRMDFIRIYTKMKELERSTASESALRIAYAASQHARSTRPDLTEMRTKKVEADLIQDRIRASDCAVQIAQAASHHTTAIRPDLTIMRARRAAADSIEARVKASDCALSVAEIALYHAKEVGLDLRLLREKVAEIEEIEAGKKARDAPSRNVAPGALSHTTAIIPESTALRKEMATSETTDRNFSITHAAAENDEMAIVPQSTEEESIILRTKAADSVALAVEGTARKLIAPQFQLGNSVEARSALADSALSVAECAVKALARCQQQLLVLQSAQRVAAVECAMAVAAAAYKSAKSRLIKRHQSQLKVDESAGKDVASVSRIIAEEEKKEEVDEEDVPSSNFRHAEEILPVDDDHDESETSIDSESLDIGRRVRLISINKCGVIVDITRTGRRRIDFDDGDKAEMPLDAIQYLDKSLAPRPTSILGASIEMSSVKSLVSSSAPRRRKRIRRKKEIETLALKERVANVDSLNGPFGTVVGFSSGWVHVLWDRYKKPKSIRRAKIVRIENFASKPSSEAIVAARSYKHLQPGIRITTNDNLKHGVVVQPVSSNGTILVRWDDHPSTSIPVHGREIMTAEDPTQSANISLVPGDNDGDFEVEDMAAFFDAVEESENSEKKEADHDEEAKLSHSSDEDVPRIRNEIIKTLYPDLVPGVRVSGADGKCGEVKEGVNRNGWTRIHWDGSEKTNSVRPSTLRILRNDTGNSTEDNRQKAFHLGSRVVLLRRRKSRKKSAEVRKTLDATVTEIDSAGLYTVELRRDSSIELKLESKQFQVLTGASSQVVTAQSSLDLAKRASLMTSASTTNAPGDISTTSSETIIPWSALPEPADDLQVGERIVVRADATQPSLVGQQGRVDSVDDEAGWRFVVMDDGRSRRYLYPCLGRAQPDKNSNASRLSKRQKGQSIDSNISFTTGQRVTVIDDERDESYIGKFAIILATTSGKRREVRIEENGKTRSYLNRQLRGVRDSSTDSDTNDTKSNEHNNEIKNGTRVLVMENDKQIEGLVVDSTTQGSFKVIVHGDHEPRSYRAAQLVVDRNPSTKAKESGIKEAVVGSRVRITDDALLRVWQDDDDDDDESTTTEEVHSGRITEIGHLGWCRVKLDDGAEVSVRKHYLRHVENDKQAAQQYEHIDTMRVSRQVRAMLKEEGNKSSISRRREKEDDEPPQCQCITSSEWRLRLRRELGRRRLRLKADEDARNGMYIRGDDGGEEREPVVATEAAIDENGAGKRSSHRRSAAEEEDSLYSSIDLDNVNDDEVAFILELENNRQEERIGVDCDEHCMNRFSHIECTPSVCAVGATCRNRSFQRCEAKPVRIVKTLHCGFGLCADSELNAGDFVIEAIGELIDESEAKRRFNKAEARGDKHFYMIGCKSSSGLVIDATKYGNESRFINHSCDPSCELAKWQIGDEERYGVFALRRLRKGDDITFDYRYESFGKSIITERICKCGAPNCVGRFTGIGDAGSAFDSSSKSKNDASASLSKRRIPDEADLNEKDDRGLHKSKLHKSSSDSTSVNASKKRKAPQSAHSKKSKKKLEPIPVLFPCSLSQIQQEPPTAQSIITDDDGGDSINGRLHSFFSSLSTETDAASSYDIALMDQIRDGLVSNFSGDLKSDLHYGHDIVRAYRNAIFRATVHRLRQEYPADDSNKRGSIFACVDYALNAHRTMRMHTPSPANVFGDDSDDSDDELLIPARLRNK